MHTDKTPKLSPAVCDALDPWIAKFPPEQRQSAVIMALHLVQKENDGWLTEPLMDAVAAYLGMPKIAVYEVVSFYSLFNVKPVGRYKLSVCLNISCQLCGARTMVDHLKKKLGVELGETTADGKFTLCGVECLAACVKAPVLQINDTVYHENLTPDKIDQLLDALE